MAVWIDITDWLTWVHVVWIVLWLAVLVLAGVVVIQSRRMERQRRSHSR